MNLARVKRALSWRMHACKRWFLPPIAFMHIPKTAGTSISEGLRSVIKPVHPLRERMDRSLFGTFDKFHTFNEAAAGDVFLGTKPMPKNMDFISGHFSLSTLQTFCPRAKIVTFFREPCARILSHWLYNRSIPLETLKAYGDLSSQINIGKFSLIEFLSLSSIIFQLDNLQTRMLLWPHPLIPQDDYISEKHDTLLVQEALAKLDTLSHVDVIENPELEKNLSTWLGKPFTIAMRNVTTSSAENSKIFIQKELTSEVWTKLNHLSRLDLKLWSALVEKKIPDINVEATRANIIEKAIKRYEML